MKIITKIVQIGLLCVLLTSCVTSRKVNLLQEPDNEIPAYADTIDFTDYRVRIDDRLYVYVYSVDERVSKLYNSGTAGGQMRQQMNQGSTYGSYDLYTYLVDTLGYIHFPTLGDIEVRGLTTREIKRKLEAELSKMITSLGDYKMLSVDVQVVNRYFSVIGAVQSARIALRKEKVTIFEALAMAGDIADMGDHTNIRIVREIEGQTTIRSFDVRSKDIVNSEFYYIEPNDVIYIQYMPGHTFGIEHVTNSIAITAATLSFGGFIYGITMRIINRVNAAKNGTTN